MQIYFTYSLLNSWSPIYQDHTQLVHLISDTYYLQTTYIIVSNQNNFKQITIMFQGHLRPTHSLKLWAEALEILTSL